MSYLLFIGFLFLCTYSVLRISFFKKSGILPWQLGFLFLAKVAAGLVYGYISAHSNSMPDSWWYHQNALIEYHLLFQDPGAYFANIFHNPYNGVGNAFGGVNSYWNDLEGNALLKLLSLFDIFSRGHYYTNVVFYEWVTFFGPMAFYRVACAYWPHSRSLLMMVVFLIPSFIFWTSGINKEGLIFLGIGLALYGTYKGLKNGYWSLKYLLIVAIGLLLTFIFRSSVFALLSVSILLWIVSSQLKWNPAYVFLGTTVAVILVILILPLVAPFVNIYNVIGDRRSAVMTLNGHSSIPIGPLAPDFLSYLSYLPQAFAMAALRPYVWEVTSFVSFLSALEVFFAIFLFLCMLVYRQRPSTGIHFLWAIGFFCIGFILLIGYTNNNLGAIERYRSILWPLLMYTVLTLVKNIFTKM